MKLKVTELKGKNKAVGLISAKKAHPVFFKTHFGIHTFGLKFPIDILILDKNNSVVTMIENIKPNRIYFWNPKFKNVIELPEGEIKKNNIKLNSKVDLQIV